MLSHWKVAAAWRPRSASCRYAKPSLRSGRQQQKDLPLLTRLYEQAAEDLAIGTVRDREIWSYLFAHNTGALACETWLVEDAAGRAAGYFRLPEYHFGEELAVNEVSRLEHDAALAVLRWLKQAAAERGRPGVRLNLPASCTLMRLAHSLGAHELGTYAWQVHVPDFAALLRDWPGVGTPPRPLPFRPAQSPGNALLLP